MLQITAWLPGMTISLRITSSLLFTDHFTILKFVCDLGELWIECFILFVWYRMDTVAALEK